MRSYLAPLGIVPVLLQVAAGLSRTTEAQEATILDAKSECTAYNFAPATALASVYPTIWATADLSAAGITAYDKALFASMNGSIPDISPKGTRAGDFTSVSYTSADPDCWWTWDKCTEPKVSGIPDDITRCDEPNTWGFTLDDGPNCSHNAYYDYLQTIDQKATLFYIGSNVMDWPLEGQRGLSDGHEICSHTWSHPYMTAMTNEQAFAELYYSKKAIKDILGITVKCWRPPYGDVDDRIRWIANALDMVTIVWEEDTDDWNWESVGVAGVKKNYQSVLDKQANGTFNTKGTIVLTHEIDNETMVLSEQFLPTIRKQFTGGVMPIAVCMNNTNPYVEGDNYTYPNYAEWAAGTRTISLASPTAVFKDVRLVFSSAGTSEAATATSGGMVASHTSSTQASTQSTSSSTSSSGALSTGTEKATSSAAKRPVSLVAVALALIASAAFLSAL